MCFRVSRRGSTHDGPYSGRLCPKGVPVKGFGLYERVGISLVEVYKRVGKSVIWVCQWKAYERGTFFVKKSIKGVGPRGGASPYKHLLSPLRVGYRGFLETLDCYWSSESETGCFFNTVISIVQGQSISQWRGKCHCKLEVC